MKKVFQNALLAAASCVIAVYLVNCGLALAKFYGPTALERGLRLREQIAGKLGVPFDSRTLEEVAEALRKQGVNVLPMAAPWQYVPGGIRVQGRTVMPLAGIPGATSVNCNEGGFYPVYHLDSMGLNNPPGMDVDTPVALIGDSFCFGYCVSPGDGIAGNLRRAGFASTSFGQGGNGPLVELGALAEYGLTHRHRFFIWLYCGWNDLDDLLAEEKSPILMRYLKDDGFSQQLRSMSGDLAAAMSRDVSKRSLHRYEYRKLFMDMLMLRSVRGLVGLSLTTPPPPPYAEAASLLTDILGTARRRIEATGGKMLVVYLPSVEFFEKDTYGKCALGLEAIRESGVEYLDLTAAFEAGGDPLRYFALRQSGHYNLEGFQLVGGMLADWLRANGGDAVRLGPGAATNGERQ